MKTEKHTRYRVITILPILILVVFCNCNSAKRVARKRNNFLLNCRMDTLKIKALELTIRDSSIIPCLDAIISATKELPEYDERIEPLYWINFYRLKDSIGVNFESNNFYESMDLVSLFGEKEAALLPEIDREVLVYRNIKFIVMVQSGDSTESLDRIKASFLERNQKRTHFVSYRFYTAEHRIIENAYLWSNEIEFPYINGHLSNGRRKYHPINRPFMVCNPRPFTKFLRSVGLHSTRPRL